MNSNSIVNLSSSSGSNPFHEAATAIGVEEDLHGDKGNEDEKGYMSARRGEE